MQQKEVKQNKTHGTELRKTKRNAGKIVKQIKTERM